MARGALAKGIPIDLDARAFPVGSVAHTVATHIALQIAAIDDAPPCAAPAVMGGATSEDFSERSRAGTHRPAFAAPGAGQAYCRGAILTMDDSCGKNNGVRHR